MADPALDLSPFSAAVLTDDIGKLRELWLTAARRGMEPRLLEALTAVCAAQKARLEQADADARRLLTDELAGEWLPIGAGIYQDPFSAAS
jgi:hypothetical protein